MSFMELSTNVDYDVLEYDNYIMVFLETAFFTFKYIREKNKAKKRKQDCFII